MKILGLIGICSLQLPQRNTVVERHPARYHRKNSTELTRSCLICVERKDYDRSSRNINNREMSGIAGWRYDTLFIRG